MRQVTTTGLDLIKAHEKLMLTAYDDKRPKRALRPGDTIKGTLTIGWGHTGPDVTIGQTITARQAEKLLDQDLDEAEADVAALVSVALNDNEFDALVSLVFNIGGPQFKKSTVRRKLNAGDRVGAAEAFHLFNKSKGEVLSGLVARRAKEAALFLAPIAEAAPARRAAPKPKRPASIEEAPTDTPADVVENHGDLLKKLRNAVAGIFGGGGAATVGTYWRELQGDLPALLPWIVAGGCALAFAGAVWWGWHQRRRLLARA